MKRILHILNHKIVLVLTIIICLYQLGHQADVEFGYTNGKYEELKKSPITGDGTGYYFYLPMIFIYNNDSTLLSKTLQAYPEMNYHYMWKTDTISHKTTSKFFTGTPILLTPFFLLAHSVSNIFGLPTDGYAFTYNIFLTIGALFYWLIGILFLIKILKLFKVDTFLISLCIIFITFATNLGFYATILSSYSHVYSFFAVTAFIYYAFFLGKNQHAKHLLILALLLGLILILRPVNALILIFIPFAFVNFRTFKNYLVDLFKNHLKTVAFALLMVFCMIGLHLLYFYLGNSSISLNGYKNEGFDNIASPELLNVMFSFRKGLFIYAPILILFFPAIFILFSKNKYLIAGITITLFAISWIIASWWYWSYGGSFGSRPFIEFTALFFLPIMLAIHRSKWLVKAVFLTVCIIGLYLTSTYQYQFNQKIIHYDNMNYKKFKHVFLETDARFNWIYYHDVQDFDKNLYQIEKTMYYNPIENTWSSKKPIISKIKSPNYIFLKDTSITPKENYKLTLSGEAKISNKASKLPLEIQLWENDDKIIKQENYFIGSQIPDLNEYKHFELYIDITEPQKLANSLRLVLLMEYKNEFLKNLKLTYYKD